MEKAIKFSIPISAEYANKDLHFINFITKDFPEFLKVLEDKLELNKYLTANSLNISDISISAIFFRLSHNP